MGFGRGKGFTTRVRTEMTSYSVKGGGGRAAALEVEATPTYEIKYGGTKASKTLTELTPIYDVEVTAENTEEQVQYNLDWALYSGLRVAIGQRLTIPDRKVTKLGFWLFKNGEPAGNVTFRIYRVDGDSLVAEKVWGAANDLPTEITYEEVTLDTPVTINEEVRIAAFYEAGDSSNNVEVCFQKTDVKADEIWTQKPNAAWADSATRDCAYRYKYS